MYIYSEKMDCIDKMQNALRLPEECLGNLQGERRLNYDKNGKKITGSFGGGSDASDIVLYAVGTDRE